MKPSTAINQTILMMVCLIFFNSIDCDAEGLSQYSIHTATPQLQYTIQNLHEIKTAHDISGKEALFYESIKNKPVLFRFWSPNCGFTLSTNQPLNELFLQFKDDIVFYDVISNWRVDIKEVNRVRKKYQLSIPALLDKNAEIADVLNAVNTPELFVFNKDGKLVYRGSFYPFGEDGDNINITVKLILDQLILDNAIVPFFNPSPGCLIQRNPIIRIKD